MPIYILKCKVIPSQRIISKAYIWLIVYKNKPNKPGGYINSANCTCTAGICVRCNQVTDVNSCRESYTNWSNFTR